MSFALNFGRAAMSAMLPVVTPLVAGGPLRVLLETAIEGNKQLSGAKKSAAGHLRSAKDHEAAITAVIVQHVALAGAQGFVTNVGGLLTSVLAIPANIAGTALVQCRMIAAVAHLRGYDLDDNRVRSSVLMTMLGEKRIKSLILSGNLPSTPLGVATAPVFDVELDRTIAEYVMSDVLTSVTGKRLGVMVTKRIPVLGGGVGLAVDGWSTQSIARYAQREFPNRRPS